MDPLAFEVTFGNHGDELKTVHVKQVNPVTVTGLPESPNMGDLIESMLKYVGEAGVTAPDLADEMEKPSATVRARLAELAKEGRAEKRDKRWYAKGRDDQQEHEYPPDPF